MYEARPDIALDAHFNLLNLFASNKKQLCVFIHLKKQMSFDLTTSPFFWCQANTNLRLEGRLIRYMNKEFVGLITCKREYNSDNTCIIRLWDIIRTTENISFYS